MWSTLVLMISVGTILFNPSLGDPTIEDVLNKFHGRLTKLPETIDFKLERGLDCLIPGRRYTCAKNSKLTKINVVQEVKKWKIDRLDGQSVARTDYHFKEAKFQLLNTANKQFVGLGTKPTIFTEYEFNIDFTLHTFAFLKGEDCEIEMWSNSYFLMNKYPDTINDKAVLLARHTQRLSHDFFNNLMSTLKKPGDDFKCNVVFITKEVSERRWKDPPTPIVNDGLFGEFCEGKPRVTKKEEPKQEVPKQGEPPKVEPKDANKDGGSR